MAEQRAMGARTSSPGHRLDTPPETCPRCDRSNGRGGKHAGWIEYTGQDDYPMAGCGCCGFVVYLVKPMLSSLLPCTSTARWQAVAT